ncbi:MAG: hypothetical protein LBR79_02115 [Oscillospiraceae bacterium]|jgi:hypothetical protein|nr:hypothetical protein [Oscillospiraceae bacterium]
MIIFLIINKRNFYKKILISKKKYDTIYWRDCNWYALKREVVAENGQFFRGVCPILNRARITNILDSAGAQLFMYRVFLAYPGITAKRLVR